QSRNVPHIIVRHAGLACRTSPLRENLMSSIRHIRVGAWFAPLLLLSLLVFTGTPTAQTPAAKAPPHAKPARRLLISNAMVIYGNAKPPYGPVDILIQDGLIAQIQPSAMHALDADAVIDATGKYVMPGLIDTHMHWHDSRAGLVQ